MENESFIDYKKRVMDPISPSFCAAKWLNSTLWLGSGTTASCHLPPAHRIPVKALESAPSALHNTQHKLLMRAQMLRGERPQECEYCWKIEDLEGGLMSDRLFKTRDFSEDEIRRVASNPAGAFVNPRTLEISFDRSCQFACSYCNASFSTSWGAEIQRHGPYRDLRSDGGGAYRHHGAWAQRYSEGENPYLRAFWRWWPELSRELKEIRVTGGEPLLSRQTWKLIDSLIQDPRPNLRLAINSNLDLPGDMLERLTEASWSIQPFHLYTSCEATGAIAEYIRDGLDYHRFERHVDSLLTRGRFRQFSFMLTVSALSLPGLSSFLERIVEWKERFSREDRKIHWMVNILRFPSFMSSLVLPREFRREAGEALEAFLVRVQASPLVEDFERESVRRLISFLQEQAAPHSRASDTRDLQLDFKAFFSQYDQRRGKSFSATFPRWADWFDNIPYQPAPGFNNWVEGDSSKGWHRKEELLALSKRYGISWEDPGNE